MDIHETIYQQDCQFYRHQDTLMWSRFQAAALVEGAILYGLFGAKPIGAGERHMLLVVGTLLVLVLCTLSAKDRADGMRHLTRIRDFEKGGSSLPGRRWMVGGYQLMLTASALLTVANVLLIFWHWK